MTTHATHHAGVVRGSSQWTWLGVGLAVGFVVPYVFADRLGIDRDVYYGIYAVTTLALIGSWLRAQGKSLSTFLLHNWPWGVAVGGMGAVVAFFAVLRADDATAHPDGFEFAVAVVWRGIVYGTVDGLLLAVFPILVVYAALEPHRRRWLGKIAVGAVALLASLAMTTVYHVGYAQFRDQDLARPVAGITMSSIPTLVTASPVAAPIAHVAQHVTAVVHSYETELFLPPSEQEENK